MSELDKATVGSIPNFLIHGQGQVLKRSTSTDPAYLIGQLDHGNVLYDEEVLFLDAFLGDLEPKIAKLGVPFAVFKDNVVRNRIKLGDLIRARKLVRPIPPEEAKGPYECHKLDNQKQVFFYEQDFYFLSNFSSFNVEVWGIKFQTSEHAYHWRRFEYGDWQAKHYQAMILNCSSAHEAFKIAQEGKTHQSSLWDKNKEDAMKFILKAKLAQHEYVRRKLLETGDRELIEDSWRDSYWGWGEDRKGKNRLGHIWMEIRKELRDAKRALNDV